ACHDLLLTEKPLVVLKKLLAESGYDDYVKTDERASDKKENLLELQNFLDDVEDLSAFLERAALEADPPGREEQEDSVNRVVISTLHAAKGLEFSYVFLVGLEEGLLPHKMAVEEGGQAAVEEERRLTYVGMTRAKEKLYLSHARVRRMFQHLERVMASRFLKEIPSEFLHKRTPKFTVQRGVGTSSFRSRR
ncbi:MAG: ATP-binding domain-containing protein, partial [Magnetococcus sp. YQC-5]